MLRRSFALVLSLAVVLPVAAGRSDTAPGSPADFERALDAVARGEIKRLSEIMPRIEEEFGGRTVEIELETDEARWIYEFEILTPDGRLFEVDVDAVTGETIDVTEEVD